jgi:hypothetical protein
VAEQFADALSREESVALRVPATVPLLKDWRGPVTIEDHENWCEMPTDLAVVLELRGDGDLALALVAYRLDETDSVHEDWFELKYLYLDLIHAECRDRVARVLADTAKSARGYSSGSMDGVQWSGGVRDWVLYGIGDLRFCAPGNEADDGIPVAGLAALVPGKSERILLPDASWWVDAAALAAVAWAWLIPAGTQRDWKVADV